MIMPKNRRAPYEYDLPILDCNKNLYSRGTNFWITEGGELLECKDHEQAARDYIRNNDLLLKCVDWMKETSYIYRDYRSFVLFKLGWIRLVTGENPEDGLGITVSGDSINEKAYKVFKQCLKTSFTDYCTVDVFYEDNKQEQSTTWNNKMFPKMIACLGTMVKSND